MRQLLSFFPPSALFLRLISDASRPQEENPTGADIYLTPIWPPFVKGNNVLFRKSLLFRLFHWPR